MDQEYSDLKIVWHKKKLKSFLKGEVTAPIHIRIKPTNRCIHSCFYCVYNPDFSGIHSKIDRKSEIPRKKMLEILSDLKNIGVKAVTYSGGGEPLIYPSIEETLEKTLEYGIDLAMITNGQRLDGKIAELLSNAHWVRVSSDSCDPKTFVEIRKRPEEWFYGLTENIKSFAQTKKPSCVLGINFVVHEKNANQIYEAAGFYRGLGVAYVRFSPVWNQDFLEYHKPLKEKVTSQIESARSQFQDERFRVIDTLQKDFELSGISQRTYPRCYFMQVNPIIGADSVVYFCHNKAYDSKGILGSVKDRSFSDLWFSPEAAKIFREFNPREGCKHQCSNDAKNIAITKILESYGPHVNFA